ncbi:MAG: TIGR04086 family membrane protein [Clostridiales bacterium]|nr:TIGR04086 family membrane protein [Clostridiales bacterium]
MRKKPKAAVHAGGNTLLSYFLNLLKGTAAGLIVTVAALLLFALLVKLFHIGDGAIPAVNMVIKIGSIFVAVLITLKFIRERGYLAGGLTGILYILLSFAVFSLFKGDWSALDTLVVDLLTGLAAGLLSGILIANIKKK